MSTQPQDPCHIAERLQQQKDYLRIGALALAGIGALLLFIPIAYAIALTLVYLLNIWFSVFTGVFGLSNDGPNDPSRALALCSLVLIGLIIWLITPSIRLVWCLATKRIAKAFKG